MDATFNHTCTQELVVQTVAMIAAAVTLRFALFGCSGVAAHKGPTALFSKCAAWLQNTWPERLWGP